jgi:hypothetical protein
MRLQSFLLAAPILISLAWCSDPAHVNHSRRRGNLFAEDSRNLNFQTEDIKMDDPFQINSKIVRSETSSIVKPQFGGLQTRSSSPIMIMDPDNDMDVKTSRKDVVQNIYRSLYPSLNTEGLAGVKDHLNALMNAVNEGLDEDLDYCLQVIFGENGIYKRMENDLIKEIEQSKTIQRLELVEEFLKIRDLCLSITSAIEVETLKVFSKEMFLKVIEIDETFMDDISSERMELIHTKSFRNFDPKILPEYIPYGYRSWAHFYRVVDEVYFNAGVNGKWELMEYTDVDFSQDSELDQLTCIIIGAIVGGHHKKIQEDLIPKFSKKLGEVRMAKIYSAILELPRLISNEYAIDSFLETHGISVMKNKSIILRELSRMNWQNGLQRFIESLLKSGLYESDDLSDVILGAIEGEHISWAENLMQFMSSENRKLRFSVDNFVLPLGDSNLVQSLKMLNQYGVFSDSEAITKFKTIVKGSIKSLPSNFISLVFESGIMSLRNDILFGYEILVSALNLEWLSVCDFIIDVYPTLLTDKFDIFLLNEMFSLNFSSETQVSFEWLSGKIDQELLEKMMVSAFMDSVNSKDQFKQFYQGKKLIERGMNLGKIIQDAKRSDPSICQMTLQSKRRRM